MVDVDGETADGGAEHAVIARFRLAQEGFGGEGERSVVREAQGLLREAIERAGVGEFDGNEFGGGDVVLYAYGPDADALFGVMEATLRGLPLRPAHVVLRYGSAADPSAAEVRVEL
ncbi:hypothetical protein [Streptacidiphilus jiangxiensis]|uniref:Uncharacterized protein n=1 Tax=Streptacidiphilus jiangxiensis TaxID=235985 RepID=A0A1H7I107_STRJI|nr:hypothetical protein [Streptacidiphilus jiangxiensis]SEK54185.1 hypothetical protein SAMN05414137_102373 [Streptacidiphilus jiangxiensis]